MLRKIVIPLLAIIMVVFTAWSAFAVLPEPTIYFAYDSDYSDSKAIIGIPSTTNGLIDNVVFKLGSGSVYFNGSYDEIRYNGSSVANLNNNSIDRTISFWAKIKRLDPNGPNFIRIGNNPVIGAFADDDELWYGWWDYGGYVTGYNFSNNEWRLYTFVITASNNNDKLYLDGILVADYNESASPAWEKGAEEDIDIFGSSLMTFFDKEAWVDDVRIYEGVAFNESQVQELYNLMNGNGTSENPYQITNCLQLQAMDQDETASYILMNNIDCSDTINWNSGEGFLPIGDDTDEFVGTLDGQGYSIINLYINTTYFENVAMISFGNVVSEIRNLVFVNSTVIGGDSWVGTVIGFTDGNITNVNITGGKVYAPNDYVGGLVSQIDNTATIRDCHLVDVDVSAGGARVGGLVGYMNTRSYIANSSVSGSVSGGNGVGGLIGRAHKAVAWNADPLFIIDSHSTASVSGAGDVGGLVGHQDILSAGLAMSNCYFNGTLYSTAQYNGGLIGQTRVMNISNCYATGSLSGTTRMIGGLVGEVSGDLFINNSYFDGIISSTAGDSFGGLTASSDSYTKIENSYAKGIINVTSLDYVGGLTSYSGLGVDITNSYADMQIYANNYVGGFIGYSDGADNIINSYSSSLVSGSSFLGGLIAFNSTGVNVVDSYYDTNVSGQSDNDGRGVPKSTAEMQLQATFTDWDFNSTWEMIDYPHLQWEGLSPPPCAMYLGTGTALDPYQVTDLAGFDNIRLCNLSANYKIMNDINASSTSGWPSGFQEFPSFYGVIDGNNKSIDGLYLSNSSNHGLFSSIESSAVIKDLGITNIATYATQWALGALANYNFGTVTRVYLTGGASSSQGGVSGMVVYNYGTISDSYSRVQIGGMYGVAGIAIYNVAPGVINNTYHAANVGAGWSRYGISISNSGVISNTYWDNQLNNAPDGSAGGVGKTTAQMKNASTFAGWDFTNTWGIQDWVSYPYLNNPGIICNVDDIKCGLVEYWDMDDVGNQTGRQGNYNLTQYGSPIYENTTMCKGNGCYLVRGDVDGSPDPDSFSTFDRNAGSYMNLYSNESVCVSFWANLTADNTGYWLWTLYNWDNGVYGFSAQLGDGVSDGIRFSDIDGGGQELTQLFGASSLGGMHHYTNCLEPTTGQYFGYVDGVLELNATLAPRVSETNSQLALSLLGNHPRNEGDYNAGAPQWMTFDEIAIYNRMLTPSQISYLASGYNPYGENLTQNKAPLVENYTVSNPVPDPTPAADTYVNITFTTQSSVINVTIYNMDGYSGTFECVNATVQDCIVSLPFYAPPGDYYANATDGTEVQDLGVIMTYGQLSATQRTGAGFSYSSTDFGGVNVESEQTITFKNVGNKGVVSVYMTGYDLLGNIVPSKKINASYFKAGRALNESVSLQHGVPVNVTFDIIPGPNSTGSIKLYMNVPADQYPQQYVSTQAWGLDIQYE